MKVCPRCQLKLELSHFGVDRKRKDGLNPYCHDCRRAIYHANKERLKGHRKEYRIKHKETISKKYKEWRAANTSYLTSSEYKDRKQALAKARYHSDNIYRVRRLLGWSVRNSCKKLGVRKKKRITAVIGCDVDVLEFYLGKYPGSEYDIDHICPLSQAQTEEEVYLLSNYQNLRWMKHLDNMKKSNLPTEEAVLKCRELLKRDWINE